MSYDILPLLGVGSQHHSTDGLEMDMKRKGIGIHKLFWALSLCQVSELRTLVTQPVSQLADWP